MDARRLRRTAVFDRACHLNARVRNEQSNRCAAERANPHCFCSSALAAIVANLILSRANWRWVFFVGVVPAVFTLWIQHNVPEPELWHRHAQAPPLSRAEKGDLWRAALPRLLPLLSMNTFLMFAWW